MPPASSVNGEKGSAFSNSAHGPKIGRKGDPRMHRAVAARMENPDMSLFDALREGGFHYASDDDPNIVDNENITLGQRKNQLSRRLRLAKKEQQQQSGSGGTHSDDGASSNGNGAFTQAQTRQAGDAPAVAAANVTIPLVYTNDTGTAAVGTSTAAVQKVVRRGYPGKTLNLGRKRASDDDDSTTSDSHSISVLQERLALEQQQKLEQPIQKMAKYHPDYQHLIIPPRGAGLAVPASLLQKQQQAADARSAASQQRIQNSLQDNLLGQGIWGGLAGFNVPGAQAQASLAMPPPSVSNVAVRSLTSTAQSVGMTLEQLALTLSTSKNLMKLLTDLSCAGGDGDECQGKKHDLALKLHEYESKTLPSRCMLLAGYGHEVVQEGSPTQMRFALEAWQNEGKRLQTLLRQNSDVTLDDAPLMMAEQQAASKKLKTGKTTMAASAAHHHHHGDQYYNPYSTDYMDGRHVHRLEGKCGHRAILHHPDGGPPHIDFVVGDKIECYGNVKPFGASATFWPSRYKCKELDDCHDSQQCGTNVVIPPPTDEKDAPDGAQPKSPRAAAAAATAPTEESEGKVELLDMSTVDLTSKEWISEISEEVLMSLINDGDKKTAAATTASVTENEKGG